MKVIKARSPFSAIINVVHQIETKVELFIWNKPDSLPASPNYTFSKKIVNLANPISIYNLSNQIQEFLLATMPTTNGVINEQDSRLMWCNVRVKTYYKTSTTFILSQTLDYVAVNGYVSYQDGLQNTNTVVTNLGYYFASDANTEENIPLINDEYPYIDLLIDKDVLVGAITIENGIAGYNLTTGTGIDMYRIPILTVGSALTDNYLFRIKNGATKISEKQVNLICEDKYGPMLLSFIGRLGGWEHIYCFKAKEESIDVKGIDFRFNQNYADYDVNIGQTQVYNLNGKKSIKVNTGFVEESTNALVEQLFLSETIILNKLPVILKSKSTVLKQTIKEFNINYTFDFEYNFNLINNVI